MGYAKTYRQIQAEREEAAAKRFDERMSRATAAAEQDGDYEALANLSFEWAMDR